MWLWDSSGDAPLRNPPYFGMLRTDFDSDHCTRVGRANDGINAAGLRAPPYALCGRRGEEPCPTVGLRQAIGGAKSPALRSRQRREPRPTLVVSLRFVVFRRRVDRARRLARDDAPREQLPHLV